MISSEQIVPEILALSTSQPTNNVRLKKNSTLIAKTKKPAIQQIQEELPVANDLDSSSGGISVGESASDMNVFSEKMDVSEPPQTFIDRVSNIPLVNQTLRAYESGKNRSSIMKYSAASVEYSVKTLCSPVINSLIEPKRWDSYACEKLDALEKNYPVIKETPQAVYHNSKMAVCNLVARFAQDQLANMPWQQEVCQKTAECLEIIRASEAYMHQLINQLHMVLCETPGGLETQLLSLSGQINTRKTEAQQRVTELTAQIRTELVDLTRKVVETVNHSTVSLPLHARELLKKLILGLPQKIFRDEAVSSNDGQVERVLHFANEALIMIKSIGTVISTYLMTTNSSSPLDQ